MNHWTERPPWFKPRWRRRMKNDTKPRRTRLSPAEAKLCDQALARQALQTLAMAVK